MHSQSVLQAVCVVNLGKGISLKTECSGDLQALRSWCAHLDSDFHKLRSIIPQKFFQLA
jgi:hypothetical protein